MTPAKKLPVTPTNPAKPKRTRTETPPHSAREKTEAVLAVWTERRKPAAVCQELAISWQVLQQWQGRALAGMLKSLEPRVAAATERPPNLSRRLRKLLDKQARHEQAAREPKAAVVAREAPSPVAGKT